MAGITCKAPPETHRNVEQACPPISGLRRCECWRWPRRLAERTLQRPCARPGARSSREEKAVNPCGRQVDPTNFGTRIKTCLYLQPVSNSVGPLWNICAAFTKGKGNRAIFTIIFICQRDAMRMTGMKALPARPSFQCPATATHTPSTMAKVLWNMTPRREPDICKANGHLDKNKQHNQPLGFEHDQGVFIYPIGDARGVRGQPGAECAGLVLRPVEPGDLLPHHRLESHRSHPEGEPLRSHGKHQDLCIS